MPLNILRIYYQTLSGASIEETKSTDVVKQTEWLLTELLKEYHNKGDDLVKPESEENVSILADIDDLLKVQKKEKVDDLLERRREKIAHLNSVMEHLEEVYQTNEAIRTIFDKVKVDAAEIKKLTKKSTDDIIISDSSDTVDSTIKLDNKSDINDENDNNNDKNNSDEDIKTRITHDVDEL